MRDGLVFENGIFIYIILVIIVLIV